MRSEEERSLRGHANSFGRCARLTVLGDLLRILRVMSETSCLKHDLILILGRPCQRNFCTPLMKASCCSNVAGDEPFACILSTQKPGVLLQYSRSPNCLRKACSRPCRNPTPKHSLSNFDRTPQYHIACHSTVSLPGASPSTRCPICWRPSAHCSAAALWGFSGYFLGGVGSVRPGQLLDSVSAHLPLECPPPGDDHLRAEPKRAERALKG